MYLNSQDFFGCGQTLGENSVDLRTVFSAFLSSSKQVLALPPFFNSVNEILLGEKIIYLDTATIQNRTGSMLF